MSEHKIWLDNEYSLWIKALQESTIDNFKEHPQVQRMLSEVDIDLFPAYYNMLPNYDLFKRIDNIGRVNYRDISGTCLRMIYYAKTVLDLNPASIAEIGGGVGQFYAILKALGYEGDYYIYDLPEVEMFQNKYLRIVRERTGLFLPQKQLDKYDLCVSFYALGEFDDEWKAWYIENVLSKCERGFIIWNPHSSATPEVPFKCKIEDEYPLTGEGNKQLTWQ